MMSGFVKWCITFGRKHFRTSGSMLRNRVQGWYSQTKVWIDCLMVDHGDVWLKSSSAATDVADQGTMIMKVFVPYAFIRMLVVVSMVDQVVRRQKVKPTTGFAREYKTSDRRWRELSKRFKSYCKPRHLPCWLCKTAIDYQLSSGPWCFETDHYHPRKTHPHLMFEWSNLRPSHRRCNRARQANVVAVEHEWVKPTW